LHEFNHNTHPCTVQFNRNMIY